MVAPIPTGLSFGEVAPATEGAHYALSIIRKAGIRSGQDVLVYGATGAIGSAAVQLLADIGARVVAVCGTAGVDLVRGLGADRVIDRETVDYTQDEQRYDVVFDAVGKSSFGRVRRLLKPSGLFLTTDLGPWSQNLVLPVATRLSRGRTGDVPVPDRDPGDRRVLARTHRGWTVPPCDRPAISLGAGSSRRTATSRPGTRSATWSSPSGDPSNVRWTDWSLSSQHRSCVCRGGTRLQVSPPLTTSGWFGGSACGRLAITPGRLLGIQDVEERPQSPSATTSRRAASRR